MCGFLCSSYFVCLSLTEGLRIFHHFTVYRLPDFTTLCRPVYYCVMPGNYRQGSNTPRRAEPSIQFIRGIKSKDKPSFENLLNCATDNLCQSVRHATVVCFNNWSRYMSEWPQYLLKHYILYHDLVAKVIIVLNQSVKKTRGHQITLTV